MSVSNLETLEGWITAKDGAEIYIKTWKSASKSPIATMVFVHGLGEHVNRYNDVFPKFQIENIEVHAFDQRGFGRTARRNKDLGITISWKTAISDITEVLIRTRREGIPQFLFGHSMGGGWSLYYACEGPERNNLAGIIISAPLITLAEPTKISEPVLKVGGAISKVLPNFHVPISMNANYLTRVPEEVQKYQNDPLISTTAPLRFLSEMLQVAKSVLKPKYNRNIKGPIYISHGTGDCVTSYKASRQLYEMITATDKTLCEWPGLYHEMHNEAKRDQVINGWIRWILDHAKSAKNDYAKNSQSAQAIQNPVNIGLVSA